MAITMDRVEETLFFFAFTTVELAVLFVGISFLVGVINELVPQEKMKRLLSGKGGRGYFIGAALGGLTPFCSCSTIPVTVGLLRARAGFGPTMTFLFTSPLVNPIIIPLFFTLLGFQVTAVYMAVALTLAMLIGCFLERAGFAAYIREEVVAGEAQKSACCPTGGEANQAQTLQPVARCCDDDEQRNVPPLSAGGASASLVLPLAAAGVVSQPNRWRRIFDDALRQFRRLMPFIILGVAIGSLIHGFLPADMVVALAGADNAMAVPIAAVVGIPLYLRASTMVPIAATLMAKGMSIGAVIALIIGGAGASLPEVAMLKGIFKTPLLLAFLASVMVMAVSAGFLINLVLI